MTRSSRRRDPRRLPARIGACLTGAALLGAAAVLPATAAPDAPEPLATTTDRTVPQAPTPQPAVSGRWFVEVGGKPTARGGSARAADRAQDAVVSRAASQGLDLKVRERFSTTWNGISVEVADDEVGVLREVAGVVDVFPVYTVERPAEPVAAPELASALAMTGADVAQSELGLTGEGVKVGVIDSGIDYDHPDFGGTGRNGTTTFPTARVAYGYDFVGDAYDASASGDAAVPKPDTLPDDCGGHGTHVAGIVGASGDAAAGGVVGVAPGATLGAYRVFGCSGSSDTEVILAAMERAADDGMDVVNMSLGASYVTWPSYPTAVAADTMVDRGVVMVISQGNEGDMGTFSGGAPSVSDKAISVASFENTLVTSPALTLDSGETVGYATATGAPPAPTSGSLEVVAPAPHPDGPVPADSPLLGCTPVEGVAGQALLVSRGTCSFHQKAVAAQEAGAAALIIYNNVPGMINATVEGATPITIPVVTVSLESGLAIQGALADGAATLTWTEETTQTVNPAGGLVSDFSSYGLSADLTLKPDLGAPGGQIYSTYPLEEGAYASISGTSMAAPHVAGSVALLLQARPDLSPAQVRDVLQNSADRQVWSGNPGLGLLEPVHRQGAGLLDIDDAILATTAVSPGKISLGESETGPVTTTLTLTNDSDAAVTYAIGSDSGIATAGSSLLPGFYLGEAVVDAPASVTVPAGGSASVDVTVTAPDPEGLPGFVYGGWVTFTSGDDELVVPFAGLAGDYQDVTVLTDYPGLPLPALGAAVDGELYTLDGGHTYSMTGDDVPYVVYRLDYPVSDLRLDVYRATADGKKGAPVHPRFHTALSTGELGRSQTLDFVGWDGTTPLSSGNDKLRTLPDGDYVVVVTAVKALGDPRNPDHVETWTSPAFTIGRD
ncbi:Fn3 domain-containing protein [Georgenia soli]|uniref:Fn3 domain-containing protein n=1 Tax=Georgenia soli TaxID=638953 RepID=A0A2A9ELB9_9MICO|nr:S8 family serine peptidase [Georgenia soli]PFG39593.1 Fn3 domain-containing protein [Georgenia soli]